MQHVVFCSSIDRVSKSPLLYLHLLSLAIHQYAVGSIHAYTGMHLDNEKERFNYCSGHPKTRDSSDVSKKRRKGVAIPRIC